MQNGPYFPEAPLIIFCHSIPLDQYKEAELVINLFEKHQLKQRSIGKINYTVKCDELPRVDYITIQGKSNERVDLAIYTYIP